MNKKAAGKAMKARRDMASKVALKFWRIPLFTVRKLGVKRFSLVGGGCYEHA